MQLYAKDTGVTISIGESRNVLSTHIIVGSPGFFRKSLEMRRGETLKLTSLKIVCIDEADELFNN